MSIEKNINNNSNNNKKNNSNINTSDSNKNVNNNNNNDSKSITIGSTTNSIKFESLKSIFQFEYSFIGNTFFKLKPNKKNKNLNDASLKDDKNNTNYNSSNANQTEEEKETVINTNVYCIRLNRLLKTNNKKVRQIIKKIFKLNRVRDLVHAICALYDNSLPDIGASSLYDCICAPKAYTICVVRKDDTATDDQDQVSVNENDDSSSVYDSSDCLEKIEELYKQPDSIFSKLFSDDEDDETDDVDQETDDNEEDEESDENNFTNGLKSFLDSNKESKNSGKSWLLQNLIGCATLQRCSTFQLPGQDEWIIDLQLMSVRAKYRGLNIGKYLLNLIQNRDYVGNFDAIVTSSDLDAIKFYEKYGFNVDPILNSKYYMIGDIWTNTTKMCYIPPYCQLIDKYKKKLRDSFLIKKPFVQSIDEMFDIQKSAESIEEQTRRMLSNQELSELSQIIGNDDISYENSCVVELTSMENDFKKWQKLMFSAYQSQTQLFIKLKQEILTLKVKLSAKEGLIDDLKIENNILSKKNNLLKMELNHYAEIEQMKQYAPPAISRINSQVGSHSSSSANIESADLNLSHFDSTIETTIDSDLDKLISELKILSKSKQY